jgi:hypothetical protein
LVMSDFKVDFNIFISGLLLEGMVAAGVMANPVTKKTEKNLEHASQVIDTLDMLRKKTEGNLTDEESKMIEQGLHQLRMLYVAGTKEPHAGTEVKTDG